LSKYDARAVKIINIKRRKERRKKEQRRRDMESIKVTTQQLRDTAKDVDTDADTYYTQYNKFISSVDKFTTTDYIGDDADEFQKVVRDFEPDFRKLKELLNDYATFLRNTAQSYEDAADNAKQQAGALRQS
jgi:WXG100 family type VII secretion target